MATAHLHTWTTWSGQILGFDTVWFLLYSHLKFERFMQTASWHWRHWGAIWVKPGSFDWWLSCYCWNEEAHWFTRWSLIGQEGPSLHQSVLQWRGKAVAMMDGKGLNADFGLWQHVYRMSSDAKSLPHNALQPPCILSSRMGSTLLWLRSGKITCGFGKDHRCLVQFGYKICLGRIKKWLLVWGGTWIQSPVWQPSSQTPPSALLGTFASEKEHCDTLSVQLVWKLQIHIEGTLKVEVPILNTNWRLLRLHPPWKGRDRTSLLDALDKRTDCLWFDLKWSALVQDSFFYS